HLAFVEPVRRELPDLEERRARIEQPLDPLPRQQLAARRVPFAASLRAAERRLGDPGAQFLRQRPIMRRAGARLSPLQVKRTGEDRRAHYLARCLAKKGSTTSAKRSPILSVCVPG